MLWRAHSFRQAQGGLCPCLTTKVQGCAQNLGSQVLLEPWPTGDRIAAMASTKTVRRRLSSDIRGLDRCGQGRQIPAPSHRERHRCVAIVPLTTEAPCARHVLFFAPRKSVLAIPVHTHHEKVRRRIQTPQAPHEFVPVVRKSAREFPALEGTWR